MSDDDDDEYTMTAIDGEDEDVEVGTGTGDDAGVDTEDVFEEQVPTFKQREHIGEMNELDTVAGFDIDPKKRQKMMANLTGEERFRKIANQYVQQEFKGKIKTSDLTRVVERIKKIEYKNPKAFVLAYYFIKMDKKDKELSETISDYIKDEEIGVTIEDVVRYIRYIRSM